MAAIRTLAEFAAAAEELVVDDLLECSADEMAELLEENAELLRRGAMGKKQRKKLLAEHAELCS